MQRKLTMDFRRNGNPRRGGTVLSAVVLAGLAFVLLFGSTAAAQETAEVSGFLGYTLSEGFKTDPGSLISDLVRKVNPTSGVSGGAQVDFFLSEAVQVGFLWSRQNSILELDTSLGKDNVTGMNVSNYHGVFTYNWGYSDSPVRPFIYAGLGATHYQFDDFMTFDLTSSARFSTTLGGGVKVYLSRRFGFNVAGRWTPTYIKSDPGGTYCSPYWNPWYGGGCVVLANPDYSNQFKFSAGASVRF